MLVKRSNIFLFLTHYSAKDCQKVVKPAPDCFKAKASIFLPQKIRCIWDIFLKTGVNRIRLLRVFFSGFAMLKYWKINRCSLDCNKIKYQVKSWFVANLLQIYAWKKDLGRNEENFIGSIYFLNYAVCKGIIKYLRYEIYILLHTPLKSGPEGTMRVMCKTEKIVSTKFTIINIWSCSKAKVRTLWIPCIEKQK